VGLGELSFFFELLFDSEARCSCGTYLQDCPFWEPICNKFLTITDETPQDLFQLQRQVEGVGIWKGLWPVRKKLAGKAKRFEKTMRLLYDLIWEQTPPHTRYIIDSSKTAYTFTNKAKALFELCQMDLRVIHLVRDVRGVMWSMISKGLNRDLDRHRSSKARLAGIRALAGWVHANKAADSIQEFLPSDRYLRIRYEDLVTKPNYVLHEIGQFIALDLQDVTNMLMAGPIPLNSHQITGNRIRQQKTLSIRPDLAWVDNLSTRHRLLAEIIASRQLKEYGYLVR
jgi:hypothetical protein